MHPMKPYEWHTNKGTLLDQSKEPSFNKVLRIKDKHFDIHANEFISNMSKKSHQKKKITDATTFMPIVKT